MGHRQFKPKPLEEVLAPRRPAARTPTPWRGRRGERKPLWAILGEEPPYGWKPETRSTATGSPQPAIHGQYYMGDAPYAPSTEPRESLPEPVGPEACKDHYPPGTLERTICEGAPDFEYLDCVRACVIENLEADGWDRDSIDRFFDLDWWEWVIKDHPECFARCAR